MSIKSLGWLTLSFCIGAVSVATFSQAGQSAPQPDGPKVIRQDEPLSTTLTPVSRDIKFVSVNGASPGGEASVTIQTTPGAECSIEYVTPHGTVSRARGLVSQTADADGEASWTWKIGTRTEPGTGSVTVTSGGASETTEIEIGD
jgi:hypothetical protein